MGDAKLKNVAKITFVNKDISEPQFFSDSMEDVERKLAAFELLPEKKPKKILEATIKNHIDMILPPGSN